MARYGADFGRGWMRGGRGSTGDWSPSDSREGGWFSGRGGNRGAGLFGGRYGGDFGRGRSGGGSGGWGGFFRGGGPGSRGAGYRGSGRGSWRGGYDRGYRGYDQDMGDRLREGWRDVKRTARQWFGGGRYDRGW